MRTDAHTALLGERPESDLLHRLDAELQALQSRIVQLAIALRAPLDTSADVERILQRPPTPAVATERRGEGGGRNYGGPERRVSHLWDELRALLVLRYQLCSRLTVVLGASAVHELLAAADAQLRREGFTQATDGMAL